MTRPRWLASLGSTAIIASFSPAGDEDVFAITNDTASSMTVRIDLWNRATRGAGHAEFAEAVPTSGALTSWSRLDVEDLAAA